MSVDDIELIFATNHVGHFKLYKELSPLLASTAEKHSSVGTVVVVSSVAHFFPPEKGVFLGDPQRHANLCLQIPQTI